MSYFDQPTVTVVLNPDAEPAQQNSVLLRKWTSEERQRAWSAAAVTASGPDEVTAGLNIDNVRAALEMLKVCIVSWTGPDFDGRPATPQNVALLPPEIHDKLFVACVELTKVIGEDEKKTSASPMNGQSSTTFPTPSPDGTPETSP